MTNHDCRQSELKPFEAGRLCVICGNLFFDEITPMMMPYTPKTPTEKRPQMMTREAKAASDAYIISVYQQMTDMLLNGKSWTMIDESLERTCCLDMKTLKKRYYKERERHDKLRCC